MCVTAAKTRTAVNGCSESFGEGGSGNGSSSAGRTSPPAARAFDELRDRAVRGLARAAPARRRRTRPAARETLHEVVLVPRRPGPEARAGVVERERVPPGRAATAETTRPPPPVPAAPGRRSRQSRQSAPRRAESRSPARHLRSTAARAAATHAPGQPDPEAARRQHLSLRERRAQPDLSRRPTSISVSARGRSGARRCAGYPSHAPGLRAEGLEPVERLVELGQIRC